MHVIPARPPTSAIYTHAHECDTEQCVFRFSFRSNIIRTPPPPPRTIDLFLCNIYCKEFKYLIPFSFFGTPDATDDATARFFCDGKFVFGQRTTFFIICLYTDDLT